MSFYFILFVLLSLVGAINKTATEQATQNFTQGIRMLGRHHYSEALVMFENAVRLNPKMPEYHYHKALTHFELKDYVNCFKESEIAINVTSKDNPDYTLVADIYDLAADAKVQLGDQEEADKYHYMAMFYNQGLQRITKWKKVTTFDQVETFVNRWKKYGARGIAFGTAILAGGYIAFQGTNYTINYFNFTWM